MSKFLTIEILVSGKRRLPFRAIPKDHIAVGPNFSFLTGATHHAAEGWEDEKGKEAASGGMMARILLREAKKGKGRRITS
jgi:hypothetical protein